MLKADETRNVQTLFNVHMTCDDCIKAVSDSLYSLDGVTKVDADLKEQLVTVEGTGKIDHPSIHR